MTKARDLANASTALSAVSATELGYVDGVTSAIQTQMDAKAPSSTAVTLTGTQTLTNKTLTSPALTTPTISTTTTNGDILYGTGSGALARLGIGSTSNVLTVSGGVPAWAAPAGGGKVLQVVQGTTGTTATIASSTFTDTGLTATITPTLNTSKVLVLTMQQYYAYRAYQYAGMNIRLLRGATVVMPTDVSGGSLYEMGTDADSTDNNLSGMANLIYLDSPATTSATTYKIQMRVNTTANSGSVSTSSTVTSSIILLEIGA